LPTRHKPILVASLGVSLITFALLIFGQEMIGEFEGVAAAFRNALRPAARGAR
jgi:hypothetical protein